MFLCYPASTVNHLACSCFCHTAAIIQTLQVPLCIIPTIQVVSKTDRVQPAVKKFTGPRPLNVQICLCSHVNLRECVYTGTIKTSQNLIVAHGGFRPGGQPCWSPLNSVLALANKW